MAPGDHSSPNDPGPFDAGWLASRRWFRSKTRPLRDVSVHDAAPLSESGSLLVLAASFADGGQEHYLIPLFRSPAVGPREAQDGDGVWGALAALMADGPRSLTARHGDFVLEPGAAMARLLPGGAKDVEPLREQTMGVEQSNTSVRLGDRLMLKVYRLLEPGINPEVELLDFLTESGFEHAPLSAGSARYLSDDAEPAAAAMAQSLIPARGDAWAWVAERLGSPEGWTETVAAAERIGGITREMHAALQSQPDRPGFPSRPATADELRAWQAGAAEQLDAALAALHGEARKRLSAVASGARAAFDEIGRAPSAWVCRIHGDYHLGQLLATDSGFVVTDFEGEPARQLDERRRPASPLRDVAGMLRSLDYAARTAQRTQHAFDPDGWHGEARAAFLAGYGEDLDSPLLRALELEKACYEVRYEANFRPDWLELPLGAIERRLTRDA